MNEWTTALSTSSSLLGLWQVTLATTDTDLPLCFFVYNRYEYSEVGTGRHGERVDRRDNTSTVGGGQGQTDKEEDSTFLWPQVLPAIRQSRDSAKLKTQN